LRPIRIDVPANIPLKLCNAYPQPDIRDEDGRRMIEANKSPQ
jgi:hypothetical protein